MTQEKEITTWQTAGDCVGKTDARGSGPAHCCRDLERSVYQEIIGQSKVPECEEVWAGIHHRWGEAFLREISGLVACSGYLP